MFSSRFMLFPTFKKKIVSKKFRGGGGGVLKNIFFRGLPFHSQGGVRVFLEKKNCTLIFEEKKNCTLIFK